jgi:hypothetical protein
MGVIGKAFHKEKGAIPVYMGMVAIAEFTKKTGKGLGEIINTSALSLDEAFEFIACAINEGYRKQGTITERPLTWKDAGDLAESDPDFMNLVMAEITASMPGAEAPKKAEAPNQALPIEAPKV